MGMFENIIYPFPICRKYLFQNKRNIKASFILEEILSTNRKGINYIFKHEGITFTIYYHSPYLVNVTGIKSFEQLKLAREIIELEIKITVKKVRIDNTFF